MYTSPTQQVTDVAGDYFSVTLSQQFVYTSDNLLVLSDHEKQGTTTTTTASLSWLTGSTGTYTVVYGPTGFNPATSGTTVSDLTAPLLNLTGLTPGTTYQFYVTLNCAADANSGTAGPATFTTRILNGEPCGTDYLRGRDASAALSMTLIIQN